MQITLSQNITGTLIPEPCADGQAEIHLNGNDVFRLDQAGRPVTIRALDGVLWVTQAGDPQDYMLQAGQAIMLPPVGMVVVQALRCGRMQVMG